jgi:hypothetical protein
MKREREGTDLDQRKDRKINYLREELGARDVMLDTCRGLLKTMKVENNELRLHLERVKSELRRRTKTAALIASWEGTWPRTVIPPFIRLAPDSDEEE